MQQKDSELDQLLQSPHIERPEQLERFFRLFLESILFVPFREQDQPLTDQAEYPNDFFRFLGIKDTNRNVLPCFSFSSKILEWCGNDLGYEEIAGRRLLECLPNGWWIVLNPGSEQSKEFSPWEIEKLLQGEDAIAELVSENLIELSEREGSFIDRPSDHHEIAQFLGSYAESKKSVVEIHLLSQEIEEGQARERVYVGVQVEGDEELRMRIQEEIERSLHLKMIGSDQELRVLVTEPGGIFEGFFSKSNLVYARKGFFSVLLSKLRSRT